MKLELCCDTYESAKAAAKHGIQRIELCSALSVGGLTPSYGLIVQCASIKNIEVHVMIRHRTGNFFYSDLEIELMKLDIKNVKRAGADGVVFGVLTNDNMISERNKELVSFAKSLHLEVTFHRAFDFVEDSLAAISELVNYGFDRLLTSGKKTTAIEGIRTILKLQQAYGSKIQIMAGSGVSESNALDLANTGIRNLHFSAKKPNTEVLALAMGTDTIIDDQKIQSISRLFNS